MVQVSVTLSISSMRRLKALEEQLEAPAASGTKCFVELDRSHSVHFPVPNVVEKRPTVE